jgi:hypothetical protein
MFGQKILTAEDRAEHDMKRGLDGTKTPARFDKFQFREELWVNPEGAVGARALPLKRDRQDGPPCLSELDLK